MIPVDFRPPMQLGLYLSRGTKGIASDGVKDRVRPHSGLTRPQAKDFQGYRLVGQGDPFSNWDNGPGPSDY